MAENQCGIVPGATQDRHLDRQQAPRLPCTAEQGVSCCFLWQLTTTSCVLGAELLLAQQSSLYSFASLQPIPAEVCAQFPSAAPAT